MIDRVIDSRGLDSFDLRFMGLIAVILSVGVRPRSELAAAAGLALTEQGAIIVDDDQRTSDPHIWAVGDVTDRINLTMQPVGL